MKKMRKVLSVILTLIMVLAMAAPSFAEEETVVTEPPKTSVGQTGTIIIDNPQENGTYTAYKIFDVTYNGNAYSYTIARSSEWYSTVEKYAKSENSGMTLTKAFDADVYVVTVTDSFSAANFANELKKAVSGKTGNSLSVENGVATVDNLPLGYYFVTTSTGALCDLTTTNPEVTIHDKNIIEFEKSDDQESVEVGETVNYTITGKVPDYTGYASYKYEITDTMSSGLTYNKDLAIAIGGTTLIKVTDYTLSETDQGFTLELTNSDIKKYSIGSTITVTYSATVNESAVAKIENNKAVLTYTSDPVTNEDATMEDMETVYTAKVVVDKYAYNTTKPTDHTTKLAGAQFVLYKNVVEEVEGEDEEETSTTVKYYYKWNDTDKKVEWVSDRNYATVRKTDNNGAASFEGLADGTYYLEEIEAPAGYNKLDDAQEIIVNGTTAKLDDPATTDTNEENFTALTSTRAVENRTGAQLPSTGGIGTTVFYAAGIILMAGAVFFVVRRKRA